jgi:hypothetical protein
MQLCHIVITFDTKWMTLYDVIIHCTWHKTWIKKRQTSVVQGMSTNLMTETTHNDPITCSVYYAPINTIQIIYKAC